MTRPSATASVRRLLSLAPWVAARPDGVALAEVARRFAITERQLLGDLEILSMVGVPPFTADTLVDVRVEADRVWIYPQWLDRPLRLTSQQGLALVAAGDSLLSVEGADPDGPLARALAKLADAVGVKPGSEVDIDLGAGDPEVLAVLRAAAAEGTVVSIDHYSYGRDERSVRDIEPWSVFTRMGSWYVEAWCRRAEDVRFFRVDRIASAESSGDPATAERTGTEGDLYRPDADDPRIVLALAPSARWVLEQYPCSVLGEEPDGTVHVEIPVSGRAWLERLLLRLGPSARVQRHDPVDSDDLRGAGRRAAARILERYRAPAT